MIVSPGPALQAPVRELKARGGRGSRAVTLAAAEREAIVSALREAGGRWAATRAPPPGWA